MKKLLAILVMAIACVVANSAESQVRAAVDSIATIRAQFASINKNLSRYRKVRKDAPGFSLEGGTIDVYFDGGSIKKISAHFYGEMGRADEDYYYLNDRLIFIFRRESTYSQPLSGRVVSKKENRFYFEKEKMIRWLDESGRRVSTRMSSFSENETENLVNSRKLTELARSNDIVSRTPCPATNPSATPLDPAPLSETVMNMELLALDGRTFKLADYKGKVILVNLWATWCGPCRSEMPELLRLSEEFKERGVKVIGLTSEDPVTDKRTVKAFVRAFRITYQIGWGDKEFALALMQGQVRNSIPQTFVISCDGRVLKRFVGFNSVETPVKMRKAIEEAINETPE